jgi:hypothetical protein
LAYTAQFGGGFSSTLSLEGPKAYQQGVIGDTSAGTQSPDIIGNIHIDQSLGSAQIMASLHQIRTLGLHGGADPNANPRTKCGFAVGAGGSMKFPLLSGGYVACEFDYDDGASAYSGLQDNQFSPAGAPDASDSVITASGGEKLAKRWSVFSEAGISLTPQLTALIFGSYGKFNAPAIYGDFTTYVAGAQLKYEMVNNFWIGGEVHYAGTRSDSLTPNIVDAEGDTLNRLKTGARVAGMRVRRDF